MDVLKRELGMEEDKEVELASRLEKLGVRRKEVWRGVVPSINIVVVSEKSTQSQTPTLCQMQLSSLSACESTAE